MKHTKLEMTDKARELLAEAHNGMLCETLRRSFEIFDYDTKTVKGFYKNRYGMDVDEFLSDLALSLDKVPWMIHGKIVFDLESFLARLDIVDGTEDEWGNLAKALLDGLELKLDKKDVVRNFPNLEWGFKKYKHRLGDEKYKQCIDYAQKEIQIVNEQLKEE